ncbi:hypothetical protein D3C73_1460040 [compost metagenome]
MACDQLLARAGFADDQHAGLAGGDLLQVGEQRLRPGVFENLCGGPDRGGQCRGRGEGQQLHGQSSGIERWGRALVVEGPLAEFVDAVVHRVVQGLRAQVAPVPVEA